MLDREEYVEQTYFFRTLRERIGQKLPAQEVLSQIHEEILSTTRLPMAIQFLASEVRLHGVMGPAMSRLPHYFTAWQGFVMSRAEVEGSRFDHYTALLILEREAEYKSGSPTPAGLFVYQFETISRNRLGYDEGLRSMSQDPIYDEPWREWILRVRSQVGVVDFADLIYVRSEYFRQQQERLGRWGEEESPRPILFGEKEGKIAWANRGKDPLYLFAALQRQLGYPVVPHPVPPEKADPIPAIERTLHQLELRVKLLESELKGTLDISQFYAKPDESSEERAP